MYARLLAAAALGALVMTAAADAQDRDERTWAERLGYPSGKRVLILHADDVGMCDEANRAVRGYLEKGEIQSTAAMVPCPWFDAFADWAKQHPDLDVGLHLTLTSEWRLYRWTPILSPQKVPGLFDAAGFMPHTVLEVALKAKPKEVEDEIRAQVERALDRGLKPSHIDTHMGTLYATPAFCQAYLKVSQEFGIPAMVIRLTPERIKQFRKQGYPLTPAILKLVKDYPGPKLDNFLSLPGADSYEGRREQLFEMIRGLDPGITEIIFHPSVESPALKEITGAWRQRVWAARLFSDPKVKRFLADQGVLFTTWREMKRRFDAARAEPQKKPTPKAFK